jgi:hypothetical protein
LNEQDLSKKARQVKLASILQGQTFYRSEEKELDLRGASPETIDAWALTIVDEITNVNREVWDVFARWKFINWAISESLLDMSYEGEKIILTEVQTEEKTSAEMTDKTAREQAS